MGLAAAEQWWEAWKLRVLVLGSVLLQFFLMVAAALRRRRVPPWFRVLTWVGYQGSDALAFYALATLFSRHVKEESASTMTSGGGANGLEALWAPVLLFHLGGQDGIIAYSIQDIELWHRHLVTALSQIVVAVYVFRKSWPRGDKSLLQAAIILFIPGTLKCLEKPFALWRARLSSMAVHVGSKALRIDADDDFDDDGKAKMMEDIPLDEFVREASRTYCSVGNNRPFPAGEHKVKYNPYRLFVDVPYRSCIRLANVKYISKKRDKAHARLRASLSRAFNRLYTNYRGYPIAALRAVLLLLTFVAIRLLNLHRRRGSYADADLKVTYVLLSSTAALECVSTITMAWCRMMPSPPWPDQVAQCNLLTYVAHGKKHPKLRMVASLLGWEGYLDRLWCTRNLSRVSSTACRGWLLDRLWCTAPVHSRSASPKPSPDGITKLVHDHISAQWREHINSNAAEYRRFSDSRGQWTLEKEKLYGGKQSLQRWLSERLPRQCGESIIKQQIRPSLLEDDGESIIMLKKCLWERLPSQFGDSIIKQPSMTRCLSLETLPMPRPSFYKDNEMSTIRELQRLQKCVWESLRRPFDESIIIWHLATEICFFDRINDGSEENRRCREISNYMVYLLLVNPEMLLPGARRQVFWIAYDDVVKEMGVKGRLPEDGEDMARKMIREVLRKGNTGADQSQENSKGGLLQKGSKKGLVQEARELADALKEGIGKQGKEAEMRMWRVIRGVWVEMLCFSAGRCSGYLHAKALGTGGEFLSYVWLLREYMGMRTLADTMQRRTYSPTPVTRPGSPSASQEEANGCWYFNTPNKDRIQPRAPDTLPPLASEQTAAYYWYFGMQSDDKGEFEKERGLEI